MNVKKRMFSMTAVSFFANLILSLIILNTTSEQAFYGGGAYLMLLFLVLVVDLVCLINQIIILRKQKPFKYNLIYFLLITVLVGNLIPLIIVPAVLINLK